MIQEVFRDNSLSKPTSGAPQVIQLPPSDPPEKGLTESEKSQASRSEDKAVWVKSLGLFYVILFDLIGLTGAGILLGYLAWAKWGAPWWTLLVGSLAGLTLSMFRLYRVAQKT